MRRHDVKAVGSFLAKPGLHLIGNLNGRADDLPVTPRACDAQIELANGEVFASR